MCCVECTRINVELTPQYITINLSIYASIPLYIHIYSSSDQVISENHNLDLLFDQMLRSRMNPDAAGFGNDQTILQETTDYYSQFHEVSVGTHDIAEEEGSELISGLTVKQWDGE